MPVPGTPVLEHPMVKAQSAPTAYRQGSRHSDVIESWALQAVLSQDLETQGTDSSLQEVLDQADLVDAEVLNLVLRLLHLHPDAVERFQRSDDLHFSAPVDGEHLHLLAYHFVDQSS